MRICLLPCQLVGHFLFTYPFFFLITVLLLPYYTILGSWLVHLFTICLCFPYCSETNNTERREAESRESIVSSSVLSDLFQKQHNISYLKELPRINNNKMVAHFKKIKICIFHLKCHQIFT